MGILVSAVNLTKKYGSTTALNGINLTLESGHIYGLLGPNGSGKTTFIKLLNGLLTPTSGSITFENQPIGAYSKANISYLPDQTYLDDYLKVRDFIAMFKHFYEDFDEQRALELFYILGIDITTKFKALSKGNKEKVQLVLVMSRRSKLYVLDEPIAGVDPAARDFILKVILDNYEPTASILICTHLVSDIETILDHAIFINKGNIFRDIPVSDIRQKGMTVDAYFRETFKVSDPIMLRYMSSAPASQAPMNEAPAPVNPAAEAPAPVSPDVPAPADENATEGGDN